MTRIPHAVAGVQTSPLMVKNCKIQKASAPPKYLLSGKSKSLLQWETKARAIRRLARKRSVDCKGCGKPDFPKCQVLCEDCSYSFCTEAELKAHRREDHQDIRDVIEIHNDVVERCRATIDDPDSLCPTCDWSCPAWAHNTFLSHGAQCGREDRQYRNESAVEPVKAPELVVEAVKASEPLKLPPFPPTVYETAMPPPADQDATQIVYDLTVTYACPYEGCTSTSASWARISAHYIASHMINPYSRFGKHF